MAEVTYEVVVERDESGAWLARVPSVPGCHTYGRTLDQARRRIREALGLWIDDADNADLAFELHLPAEVRRELVRAQALRERSERVQRQAGDALARAAVDLTARFGLSRRDAAELLGISHQRVQQLVDAGSDG
ncbi:MAG: type II toxin-antitoxin system HicB family antitoxin [Actinomycetota bacterium]